MIRSPPRLPPSMASHFVQLAGSSAPTHSTPQKETRIPLPTPIADFRPTEAPNVEQLPVPTMTTVHKKKGPRAILRDRKNFTTQKTHTGD